MISRYSVTLNNVSMASLNPNLLILDVSYDEPNFQDQQFALGGRDGLFTMKRYKANATVTIYFALRIYDIAQRHAACETVANWAKDGGVLVINDRPLRRLNCVCKIPPHIDSALKWTETLSVTFSAYALPYWEDITPTTFAITGTNATGTMTVQGTAKEAFMSVSVVPSATITALTVSVGDYIISLTGISVSSSQTLTIGHDENMILYIKRGSTSYLDKRTASSSDDLRITCGKATTVGVQASSSVTATFSARGLWV